MRIPSRAVRPAVRCTTAVMVTALFVLGGPAGQSSQLAGKSAEVRVWPCRLVVRPTLLGVIEEGWKRSPTLRQQCEDLAAGRAVIVLAWGKTDSQSHATTEIQRDSGGVVAARVTIPPVHNALELVAHELEHVLETVRGVDHEAESRRQRSGVWRAFGGFETVGAIESGRRVWKEANSAPERLVDERERPSVALRPRLGGDGDSQQDSCSRARDACKPAPARTRNPMAGER
jgi:hypothetical protein